MMVSIIRLLVFSIFFLGFMPHLLYGSQSLSFTATANPSTVYEGEIFELSFSLNSNQWGDFFMPDINDFQRISGPARSSQTSVVNGQASHTTTMSWRFRATSVGEFTIDQGILEMNGETLYSNPVKILVLPKGADPSELSRDILLKVELSCDTCYMGQQIAVDLYLYTTKSITDFSILAAPDFDGFSTKRLSNLRQFGTTRDTLNNRIYNKHLLRRFVIFPQMIGDFKSGEFDLRVVEQDRSSRWGGLLSVGGEVHYLSASVPSITIKAEPDSAPEGFSGLVGNFQIAGRYPPSEIRVGELSLMRVVLRGDGDPAQMRLPPIELSNGLSIADVQFEKEQIDEARGKFRFSREWTVFLRADEPGRASAYPHILAYNLELDSFYQVFGDTLQLQILPSEGGELVFGSEGGGANHDIRVDFFSSSWFKYGLPAALILFGLMFFIAFRRINSEYSQKNEFEIFEHELHRLKKLKFPDQKSHYSAVLQTLETFLVKISGLPMSEWNEADLKNCLTKELPEKESNELLKIRQALINSTYGYYPYEGDELESLLLNLIKDFEGRDY